MVSPAPTTRRDFLRGRPLAQAVRDLGNHGVAGVESSSPQQSGVCPISRWGLEDSTPATQSCPLITVSRRAMACQFEIVLPATMPRAVAAASAALDEIDRLEDQMTVYRDTSEVSQINALAAVMPVPVEERLFGLFQTALRLNEETDGAFDMAVGALVKCWGFLRGPKRVPQPQELARVLERVGTRHIALDRVRRTIEFRRPGLKLNLGAIGKGYALDRAAELLRRDWSVTSAILHGGQSSVCAIGTSPHGHGLPKDSASVARKVRSDRVHAVGFDNSGRAHVEDLDESGHYEPSNVSGSAGWLVAIAHPPIPGEQVATVRLRDAALGTSGATLQYFEANGQRFGHILDPRTGWPAEGRVCVSVIAPTAAEADALSTAFFILGPERACEYCDRHPEIGVILVTAPESDTPLKTEFVGRAQDLATLQQLTTDD